MWSPRLLVPVLALSAFAASAPAADKPFGLERRIPWNDSKVVGSPEPLSPYKVVRAFPKLEVKQPLAIMPEPGTNRLFILQHLNYWAGPGRLLAIEDDQNSSKTETLLDIDGLAVGFAFHPQYQRNGYLYIGLNGQTPEGKKTAAHRYTVDRVTGKIDPKTKLVIIEWNSNGHDGGDVAFGNDGYLYVSSGDGSSDSDQNLTGQTIDDLLASMLRIDVDHPDRGRNYSVPKDNPFVNRPGARPELWAYGFRNPWRISFDAKSNQLWVGQNGQDLWEQVYLVRKGANYGWSVTEGSKVFHAKRQAGPDPISPPAAEHSHSEARSLTGGRVYRGASEPGLVGAYIYGDWSTGRVWGIKHDGEKVEWHRELVDTPFNITGFGMDHSGEMYVIDQITGFYRLVATTEADKPARPFPTKLSESGLFESVASLKPHASAIHFDVATPQWADGATMDRLAFLTGEEKIAQRPQKNAGGAWTLPEGSVMTQTLSLDVVDDKGKVAKKRIETRVSVRQQGEWFGYSYKWNDEQTDAELVGRNGDSEIHEVPASKEGGRREQTWRFPSRSDCLICHSRAAGFVLGFSPLQLDRDHDYGGTVDNQLRTFEHIGLFEGTLPKRAADASKLVDAYDAKQPLDARVRSYLHVNCSTCHVKEGGGNALIQLDLNTPINRMNLVNQTPQHDRFDIPDAKLVTLGRPDLSVMYQRVSRRGTGQMPPLVTTEVDRAFVDMLAAWIKGLPPSAAVPAPPRAFGPRTRPRAKAKTD